ncbi:MAG: autotransporter domain-containing protein [Akkermansia sp.]|nr:autotransporter domain-containing protein [Akkermansia sp.]
MKITNKRILALLSTAAFVVVASSNSYAGTTTDKENELFKFIATGVERVGTHVSGDGDAAVFDAATTVETGADVLIVSGYGNVTEQSNYYRDYVLDVRDVKITMKGGKVGTLVSAHHWIDVFDGDSQIDIYDGEVGLLIGGCSVGSWNVNATTATPDGIVINVYDGWVKQIRGGNNTTDGAVDCPIAPDGVTINISGGKIGGLNPDDPFEEAILGAGGSYSCVDGKVTINISQAEGKTTEIVSSVFAGASRSTVGSTEINISGGTITADVHAGGAKTSSVVEGDTRINISGGIINADVYGGGYGDTVNGNTSIVLTGDAVVNGTLHGGASEKVAADDVTKIVGKVGGDKTIDFGTASASYTGSVKLDDFSDVNVNKGTTTIESMSDVSNVTVGSAGVLNIAASTLQVDNAVTVNGTLNVDMEGADASATGKTLTLGDGAKVNVLNAAEGNEAVSVFGFDSVTVAEDVALTLNGAAVSSDMWSFEDGTLIIKEASATTLNLSRNQGRFYQAVQAAAAANPNNQVLADLASARDAGAVKAAIDAMSGHEYATAMSSQIEGNLGHLRRLRGAMGKGEMLGMVTDEKMGTTTMGSPWRAGVSVFHEETEIDSDARGDGYDRSETGAMLNVEYVIQNDVTLGGAVSYGRTKLSTDGASSRHEDNTRFDVYALYGKKRWSFATSLGLGMHEHELLGGDVDGYSINFLQDAAYTVLSREKDNVQVFGTIESSWNEIDSCSDGVVSADSQDAWATDVTVGLRYNRALSAIGNAPAGVFTAQAGVTASIGDIKSGVDMDINGFGYRQESATRNRWGWNLGAGVDVPVRTNMSIYGTAEAVLRGDSSSVDGQVGVKVAF